MIERPEIIGWSFTNISNHATISKRNAAKILDELNKKGVFYAANIESGLGITGYEKVVDYDEAQIESRNRVILLRKGSDHKIIVTTDNYCEYTIDEAKTKEKYKVEKKEAIRAEKRQDMVEVLKPSTKEAFSSMLDNQYTVPPLQKQPIWATA